MTQLFDDVFNTHGIHNMLFFNVKSVLINQNLDELEKENKNLFDRWNYLSKTRFSSKYPVSTKAQTVYEQHAPYYAEFTKIVAITYATLYLDEADNKLKRYLKKIVNDDEYIVLSEFIEELYSLSSDGTRSTPQYFPILCGHNIIRHDIPHLIKKIIKYREKFEKGIPLILKRSLNIKPWESGIIDTVNVWNFNGIDNMSLMLISDHMGLKKTVDLVPLDEVSSIYWNMTEKEEALEYVAMQSATQTNLVVQLMNNMRQL